ncbi:MAG TPA: choice-of-anchor D domain-containing protein [Terracidiphilus sp.]|nr:choice-of-anchor D domain-containing protein [Terracidiphilus sp.]
MTEPRDVRAVGVRLLPAGLGMLAFAVAAWGQVAPPRAPAAHPTHQTKPMPARVRAANRFLAERGWGRYPAGAARRSRTAAVPALRPRALSGSTSAWQPLGPTAVLTPNDGLVSGRVTSIAMDPADATGNHVYVGTTGGGVWVSQNAGTSDASTVTFTPLTDSLAALSGAADASISIGAVTAQPGATGVVLAGTGDPNDALDSYYGAGILRSTDGGTTWSLIQSTDDVETGQGIADYTFLGEGFAGFAWSTASPQLVVAAVSQAYEGTLVNAERPNLSYAGLYYSTDAGATWHLATITDPGGDVQGPLDSYANPHGNAATAVAWNPVRNVFMAAVRHHGYYQSSDGAHWTRLTAQPGTGLTTAACPANIGSTGSVACPIFRGTLAVNPQTGDTFAWTVDSENQDQGMWQDACALNLGACTNASITFAKQWNTAALDANTALGAATILNGDYDLTLAAVPSGQDTLLMAGDNDLWKCSLAAGCTWRDTTNVNTCMSAQVAGYQHALAWNTANPLEMFVGNDGGLWRSTDAVGETGSACSSTDATHFENLNGGLGSLAEVVTQSEGTTSPYTMMAGLGVNGTAGVKSTSGPTAEWPQVVDGEGGPVAIDPANAANWYVNNQAGVGIRLCSQTAACTQADFGTTPVVTDADVDGDGATMTEPAPFVMDPLDTTNVLVGTCRVWRGPADGSGWSGANLISPMLDGVNGNAACSGDALIRTMAAMALGNGGEVIYVGMYGSLDGGATLAGHVLRAVYSPSNSGTPSWQDLALNPVTNDTQGFNAYGMDISSIYVDPHDATGSTVYVTVEGVPGPAAAVRQVYESTDGGAHWMQIASNLPPAAASSVVVDPGDANTVYVATDAGVYSTRQVGTCAAQNCWSPFGTGLPEAPVTGLSASPAGVTPDVLVAGTYGRGLWQIPLWTAGTQTATATLLPASLDFGNQAYGTTSAAQTITLTNTGSAALKPASVAVSGDFTETDTCAGASLAANTTCTIKVTFMPTATGARTGTLTVDANVAGGQMTASLSGNGTSGSTVTASPVTLSFGQVEVGTTSSALQVTLNNAGSTAVNIQSASVTGPFALATNACGTQLGANSACQMTVTFAPTQAGAATGTLTVTDDAGTQTVGLGGTGAAAATDTLAPASLTFSATVVGTQSAAQVVTLTNSGGVALTGISVSVSGLYQLNSNCAAQLAAGSSCALNVTFVPTATGTQTGTLTVTDALRTQTVSLSGTGVPAPVLSVSPASLTFATQPVGQTSAGQMVTVKNTGGSSMSNVGFAFAGSGAASFSTGTTTCGAVLANGASCTVQVLFTPTTAGAIAATLTVSSSTLGVTPATVSLSGTGQAVAGINVSPVQLNFVQATLGQTTAAQTVTVTNSGSAAASGLTLTTTAPFSLTVNTCGASLGAGASCTVGVAFTPTANGTVTGVLAVSSASETTANVALTGVGGLAGAVQVLPGSLSFATVGVGQSSAVQTVTMTNTSAAVSLTDLTLSASAGFTLSGSTCPATLGPGASCTAGVAFAPASAGAQTGTLTVASSALASNVKIPLSGMGFDFTVSTKGETSQTVASGQTADYTLSLTPLNGSTGTFTFLCGQLPANAVCVFNPSSEGVAANTTGSATVEVETGHAAQAAAAKETKGWGGAQLGLGLLLLPLAWRRRRKAMLLVLLLGVLTGGVSGCVGAGGNVLGGSTGSGGTTTPPGTYAITVTATANGVSHAVTVSLTVD